VGQFERVPLEQGHEQGNESDQGGQAGRDAYDSCPLQIVACCLSLFLGDADLYRRLRLFVGERPDLIVHKGGEQLVRRLPLDPS